MATQTDQRDADTNKKGGGRRYSNRVCRLSDAKPASRRTINDNVGEPRAFPSGSRKIATHGTWRVAAVESRHTQTRPGKRTGSGECSETPHTTSTPTR
ncbi:hypothetical protein MRX96_054598 [Rhipicephalus microplus]